MEEHSRLAGRVLDEAASAMTFEREQNSFSCSRLISVEGGENWQ
jgi:hypothetical protein